MAHAERVRGSEAGSVLVERVFEAYHVLERDISDRGVLREVAGVEGVGLTRAEVNGCLDNSDSAAMVDERRGGIKMCWGRGFRFIPFKARIVLMGQGM